MMRLLKIAKSGLGGRPADQVDEAREAELSDEHEREESPLDAAAAFDAAAADDVGDESAAEDTQSRKAEPDGFESEIGAILAMIRSRQPGDIAAGDVPEETGATYRLLSELDRIWRRA